MKRKHCKMKKILSLGLFLGLILGSIPFTPSVNAKTKSETLAYDKKIEKMEDFKKGKFEKVKVKKTEKGVELELNQEGQGNYITPEIKAPFGATHIGLHWREKNANENLLTVFLRTRNDGEEYGKWEKANVELEEVRDDEKNEEIFASLIGVENKNYAQAMVEFVSQNDKNPKLKEFTFTFINSGEMSKKITQEIDFFSVSNAGNEGVLKTSPNGQEVNVISREDWGADESYRFKDGKEDWPRSYHGTRKLVIHHTAVKKSNGETNIEKNKAEVRAIYYYHAVTQGWGDIGYNALVDASGNVYEGRYGTHDIPNRKIDDKSLTADEVMVLDTEAGHTSGYNSGSFGVAAMGDFTSFNPPVTQILGLEKVLTYVADSRGVNVQGSSDFRRYNGTWHFDLNNLIGHRNATATACPGTNLYSQIQAIKNYVDSFLPKNISGFDAKYLNDSDIEGTKIESGSLNFDWDKFQDATQYEYRLEKVFGTIGDASDSETWGMAWFPLENFSVTSERAVKIDSSELQSDSNYVFYVRALDTKNKIISTTKHVNFETGEIIIIDNESPTVPSVFSASAVSESQINLSWKASSDNIGVAGYKIYRDDSVIATTESTSYEDKNLSASTPYTYSVSAFDTSGNESAFSDSSSATTKDVDKSPPVVTIIQPSDSDYEVSGSVSISAKAEDESGIVSMNLKIDGILKATSVSGGLSYIWNTRKISFGEHTILVEAKDGAGNIGTSGKTVKKVK